MTAYKQRRDSSDLNWVNLRGVPIDVILIAIATLFVFANAISLSIVSSERISLQHLWYPTVWMVVIVVGFILLNRYAGNYDRLLYPIAALLAGWGLNLIDRLATNFLDRQTLWLIIGVSLMVLFAAVPGYLRILRRYRYTLLGAGLILVIGTFFFGVNPSGIGAALWLKIPFIGSAYFQPAELLKILLVVFLASYFDEQEMVSSLSTSPRSKRQQVGYLLPLLVMWGFAMLVVVWQQDLGAAALFFIVFLAMLYLGTGSWRLVGLGLGMLFAAGFLAYLLYDVVALRIDTWIDPWSEAADRGFQIVQSLYAIASGGIFGEGIGQGSPTYIPVVHSDFAFSALSEEWGLIASLTVVTLFAVLAFRGFRIAAATSRPFHMYLAAGFASVFSIQSLMIMGGVTKVLPLTGVTLPFVSYGGSSLLISFLMIGILINISRADRKA